MKKSFLLLVFVFGFFVLAPLVAQSKFEDRVKSMHPKNLFDNASRILKGRGGCYQFGKVATDRFDGIALYIVDPKLSHGLGLAAVTGFLQSLADQCERDRFPYGNVRFADRYFDHSVAYLNKYKNKDPVLGQPAFWGAKNALTGLTSGKGAFKTLSRATGTLSYTMLVLHKDRYGKWNLLPALGKVALGLVTRNVVTWGSNKLAGVKTEKVYGVGFQVNMTLP
jgi:hypothetical protein